MTALPTGNCKPYLPLQIYHLEKVLSQIFKERLMKESVHLSVLEYTFRRMQICFEQLQYRYRL